jgi:hypothetical protein
LLRNHIQQLLNNTFAKCKEQLTQESQPREASPLLPTLNRSHAGILRSDKEVREMNTSLFLHLK